VLTFVIRRIALSIPVLLIATLLVFVFVRSTTDPLARFSQVRDPSVRTSEALRLGLQKEPCRKVRIELSDGFHDVQHCTKVPMLEQYANYMQSVATLDLGDSAITGHKVSDDLWTAFKTTLQLIVFGVIVSALIAILVGVYSAVKQYSIPDYAITALTFLGISMPPFVFGLLAIQLGSVLLRQWFDLDQPVFFSIGLHEPDGGLIDYARHLVLPVATLTVQIVASWSRFQRSSMLDVMGADYIRTAQAKGLSRRRVVLRHGLRNGLIPLVTVMAIDIGGLFGGLIITERIFSVPGMGRLFFDSLQNGDTQVLLPWLMVSASFIILFNLLADVLYSALDPRIRVS
jgi:peptide/nickel transport system permease protein